MISGSLGVPVPQWVVMGSEPQPEGMAGTSPAENPMFWPLKAEGGDSNSFWRSHRVSSKDVSERIRH